MNEIVKVEQSKIGGAVVQTVNARELHEFLCVGKDFSTWITGRIEKYGFEQGVDFSPILGKSTGGRPEIEYHISIDMAKELSMVENNEQGRKARRYFIDCEKKLRTNSPSKALKRESADARKGLAATWSDRGATAPRHFINLTYAEYKALGYEKPRNVSKKDMTTQELARLMALEVFESVKLQRLDPAYLTYTKDGIYADRRRCERRRKRTWGNAEFRRNLALGDSQPLNHLS